MKSKLLFYLIFFILGAQIYGNVNIAKTVLQNEYDNGNILTYELKIKSGSTIPIGEIKLIEDLFARNQAGKSVFKDPVLVSAVASAGGNPGIYTTPSIGNDFLIENISFNSPLEEITYVFQVTVESEIDSTIETESTVILDGKTEGKALTSTDRITYDYTLIKEIYGGGTTYMPGTQSAYVIELRNNKNNTIKNINVTDKISEITTTLIDGTQGAAFTGIGVMATTEGTGTLSGLINNPSSGDLETTTAQLGPFGSIKYTIGGTIKADVVGELDNIAKVSFNDPTRNGDTIETPIVTLRPGLPLMDITKSVDTVNNYSPGDVITYTINVANNGSGTAYNYRVEDLLSDLNVELSSDLSDLTNAIDITGTPFKNGTIELKNIGVFSRSNFTVGTILSGIDLQDTVSIFPGESITYEIVGHLGDNAIGKIRNTSKAISPTNIDIVSNEVTTDPKNFSANIDIIKTTNTIEYTPGGEVIYSIKVTNNDSEAFANNVSIIDKIGNILTEQVSGQSPDQAFSSWQIDVVNIGELDPGTNPGTLLTGSQANADINLNVDIAPGDTIEYRVTAKIKDTSIGTIIDNETSDTEDTVKEDGPGIVMSSSKLNIGKTVNDSVYSPNEVMTYMLIVENDGDGYALNIPVKDLLADIETQDALGNPTGDKAYSSWTINYSLESAVGGTLPPTGNPGRDPGTGIDITWPISNQNLDLIADLGPETRIVYTIEATISPVATGKIVNSATVDGSLVADKGIRPTESKVSAQKSVDRNFYSDEDPLVLTYDLTISNAVDGGYAKDIDVRDDLGGINVELLDGRTENAFTSYSIIEVIGLDVDGNESANGVGAINGNGILEDVISVTAGSSITYRISATVDRDVTAVPIKIPYGSIVNEAIITPKKSDGTADTPINISQNTQPRLPRLNIVKSTTQTNLNPGDPVTFTILVNNTGNGYANNALVEDVFPTALQEWTIIAIGGSNPGSNPVISGTLPQNSQENLDLVVDIAPGDSVSYEVSGIVRSDFTGNVLENTAKVRDTQNGVEAESSAKVEMGGFDLYMTKTSDNIAHIPGETLTYTVEVHNVTDTDVMNVTISDKITEIMGNLANNGNPYVDVIGSPFESWTIERNIGGTTISLPSNKDINDIGVNIPANGKVTYTIIAEVKDTLLAGQVLTNLSQMLDSTGVEVGRASIQTRSGGDYGGTSRSVNKNNYIPGEELEYTITISGGSNGYANNIDINELINDIEVELLDGSFGNPFNGVFTVELDYSDASSSGTSPESEFPQPQNNSDIVGATPVDIAPGDKVTYKVKGIVRPDAVGTINYKGLVTEPYPYNLNILKRSLEDTYTPGKDVTFLIDIFNTSDGNANNISIQDAISALMVTTSNGGTENAFLKGWTIQVTSDAIGGNPDYTAYVNGDLDNTIASNTDINTKFDLPVGTKLSYEIKGELNPRAVGDVENIVNVDGDRTTGEAASGKPDLQAKKMIEKYFDRDGTTELSGTGYKPGGWIQYLMYVDNTKGTGIRDNLGITDKLSEITTTLVNPDGSESTGNAFVSWEISLAQDESILDSEGVTLPGEGIWDVDPNHILKDVDLVESNPGIGERLFVVDIAPGGKTAWRVKAKVDERAVGAIENIASSGPIKRSSGNSNMRSPSILLTKETFELDQSTIKTKFELEDEFYYKVKVTNTGEGISKGKMRDLLTDIISNVAEDGTNGNNPSEPPFINWEVIANKFNNGISIGDVNGPYNNGSDNVTNLDDFETSNSQKNKDIDSDSIFIAPGGSIEYFIKAKIKDNVVNKIVNTATYQDQTGTKTANVTIDPYGRNITLDKEIKYIGDSKPGTPIGGTYPVSDLTVYRPGDFVVYEFTVSNLTNGNDIAGFANNVRIRDTLIFMMGETSGGGSDVVFENWEITTDGGNDPRTHIRNYNNDGSDLSNNGGLDIRADIAPEDIVTFKVVAQVRDNLIGEIPRNTARAANVSDSTGVISPVAPEITYYKTFGKRGGIENNTDREYITFGTIDYKIVVENTGEGYGNDIVIRDKLKDVVDGDGKVAFSSFTSQVVITDSNGVETLGSNDGKNYVEGAITGTNLLDVTVDIEPGAKIEFYLEASTVGVADGDIINTVQVPLGNIKTGEKDNVRATLSNADISGIKTVTPNYVPGGEIEFIIEIRNNTDNRAADIEITDLISNVVVNVAGEAEGTVATTQALKPGWVIEAVLLDELSGTEGDISNIPATGDLSQVLIDIGAKDTGKAYSRAVITIKGEVIDNAIGEILNSFNYKYNGDISVGSSKSQPTPNTISLSKKTVTAPNSNTEITTYVPGEKLTFLVNATTNDSQGGYAKGVEISDIIDDILGELAGEFTLGNITPQLGLMFDSGKSIDVIYTGSSSNTTVVGAPDISNGGFLGTVDIHPGDTFNIWITGTVRKEALGDIKNEATAKYSGNNIKADITVVSEAANIGNGAPIKEIRVNNSSFGPGPITYKPGDTIGYKLSLTNTGKGWANDLTIFDGISQIKAEVSGGNKEKVFETNSLQISYKVTGSDYPNYSSFILIDPTATDLGALYDLAPGATMEFELSGVVKNNVVGDIVNIGRAGIESSMPTIDTNTVLATQADAELSVTKTIIKGKNYSPGEEVGYEIIVRNTAVSFANDVKILDDLSAVKVKSSDDAAIGDIGAFVNGSYRVVEVEVNDPSKIISSDDTSGLNIIADIAPGDAIKLEVYGVLVDTAIGEIENIASVEYNQVIKESLPVISTPKKPSITIEKISDLNDYVTSEEVKYTINIINTGEGIANNIMFLDELSKIESVLANGTTGRAVVENSVGANIILLSEGLPEGVTTSPLSINVANDDVVSQFDLAPGGSVRVEVKGVIENDVVGDVTNVATADYENRDSSIEIPSGTDTLGPGNADISITKNAIIDSSMGGYIPGENIEFELLLSNAGPGIANNISLIDKLSSVMVETSEGNKRAFSEWLIINDPLPPDSVSNIPSYTSTDDLEIEVDIAPGDVLRFVIAAKVINEAYGEITNTAEARYENNKNNDGNEELPRVDDATFIPSRSNVYVEKEVDIESYAPGDEITYIIRLGNTGPGPGNNVALEDILPKVKTTTGIGNALDLDTLTINTKITGGVIELKAIEVDMAGDPTLRSLLTIPREGIIEYTIKANIANNVIGIIENTATAPYTDNDGTDKTSGDLLPKSKTVVTLPRLADIKMKKIVDKEEFIAGEDLIYTVTLENKGEGIANDVRITDLIKSIEVKSVDERLIPAFKSVVITDNRDNLLEVSSIGNYNSTGDLDVLVDIAPGDKVVFTLSGSTNELVAEDIVNSVNYNFNNNDGTEQKKTTEATSKVKLNEGKLILTKNAYQREIEKGGVVEYEILVRNKTEVYFVNVAIEDKAPAGFKYIEGTTEIHLTGSDGKFDTEDDEIYSDDPVQGNTLSFRTVDIGPEEILRIRYLLRASIGTTFGKYKNTAYAVSGGIEVSNRDSAIVEVIPDELFDTATIIGKVYEDLNGDGYQGDATATNITLTGGVTEKSYIPGSTTLEIEGNIQRIPDASPPLQHGVNISRLRGVSRNKKLKESNKAVIRYETKDQSWEPLKIATKAGTDIIIDSEGRVTKNHKKDKKNGLAAEKIKITRNIYKRKNKEGYLQEIIVENLGIYEDGIPGVRLITVDGILVETDEFGRYHVPDEWVLRKTGKNFIIKVDPDTLPQGMKVISENPRVRRISPNGLNKFNFSIQRENDDFNIKDEDNVITIRGDENE